MGVPGGVPSEKERTGAEPDALVATAESSRRGVFVSSLLSFWRSFCSTSGKAWRASTVTTRVVSRGTSGGGWEGGDGAAVAGGDEPPGFWNGGRDETDALFNGFGCGRGAMSWRFAAGGAEKDGAPGAPGGTGGGVAMEGPVGGGG